MAQLAAVIASTHHPFYYKASTALPDEAPPFAADVLDAVLGCTDREWTQTQVSAAGVASPAVAG